MLACLLCIGAAHARGIMHCDLKPLNVLSEANTGKFYVTDWGLGNYYVPGRNLSYHIGTRFWKAPELLLGINKNNNNNINNNSSSNTHAHPTPIAISRALLPLSLYYTSKIHFFLVFCVSL
jgi:serine/threonine protein kinase